MKRVIEGLCRRKIMIPIIYVILIIASAILIPQVNINYDLAKYLPEESNTKKAITIMEDEFGFPGTVNVMLKEASVAESLDVKKEIQKIDGVESVLWLDDVTDVTQPIETIPHSIKDSFYKDNSALFTVEFNENDYSEETSNAIVEIREVLGDSAAISGTAENSRHMKEVLYNEIFKVVAIVVPICLLILMFASSSWIEPFIYVGVIGISILISTGTNAFFDSVSFITYSMAAVLQLAMSMDYSLFLMHRYQEERGEGKGVFKAVVNATYKSIYSIASSALTTVAGFLALVFMEYGIGADIGLVLAKGIFISFFTVITLMPVAIIYLNKLIDKTTHKTFLPSFGSLGKFILKFRYVIIVLAVLVLIPSYLGQSSNEFLYGDSSATSETGQIAEENQMIVDKFGVQNSNVLLIPSGDVSKEIALTEDLETLDYVDSVQNLVTLADSAIPREFLPSSVTKSFESDRYNRIIVNLKTSGETDANFEAIDRVKNTADRHYPDKWLIAGQISSVADIKETVSSDIFVVNLFSILAVGVVLLFTFKSLALPFILVAVIVLSTWINLSIPYFTGDKIAFIGYLVISALQLGATIDYAILLTSRYMDFRGQMSKKGAAAAAIKAAGNTIITSALILATAGFTFGYISNIDEISIIGTLLGRGAVLSGFSVLVLLPNLLVLLDVLIMKTTWNASKNAFNQKGK